MRKVLHTVSRVQIVLHPPGFYALEPLARTHSMFRAFLCVSFCHIAQKPGAAPSPPTLIHLVSECDTHPGDPCTLKQKTVDNRGYHLPASGPELPVRLVRPDHFLSQLR